MHILLTLWIEEAHLFVGQQGHVNLGNKTGILFVATFATSVVSASLGIAKFLKLGPCRLIPNEGILGGYGSLNFLLLLFNVACTMVAKGLILATSGHGSGDRLFRGDYYTFKGVSYLLWIALFLLPQLIYVSTSYFLIYSFRNFLLM